MDLGAWSAGLDELFGRVAGRLYRTEPRKRARAYVTGLLAPLAGKNGWTLAEVAGDLSPDGMQRLLNSAHWDADGVRDDLRAYAVEHLGEPGGVLIVDETGFLKKGVKSAGVQRQYSGTAGRIENCQLGVFLAYASGKGRTLIDRELYLAKSWASDSGRRREAAVPEQGEFATKAVLAQAMLARALAAGVPASSVAADEAYGQDYKFRTWRERHTIGYVVAVPCSQSIPLRLETGFPTGSRRADDLVAHAPAQAWKRRSAGAGVKGHRFYDWAVASLHPSAHTPTGWGRWLLARRQILTPAQIEAGGTPEIAYYLCAGPPGTSDDDLVRVAGSRWAIEECFQTAKNEVGPDHYPVRRYDAWYRHVTLAEIRRLTAHLNPPRLSHPQIWRWSTWRRRHQHRARESHYRRRQHQP